MSRNYQVSPTTLIADKARELREQGMTVHDLSVGEPDLELHSSVIDSAKKYLETKRVPYSAVQGSHELRDAFSEFLDQEYGVHFNSDEILVTCGGKAAIYLAIRSILSEGDSALILSPHWVSYGPMVEDCKGVPKFVQSRFEDGWIHRMEDIEASVDHTTKLVILNQGANPTGAIYSRGFLNRLGSLARKYKFWVLSDEVYSGLYYGDDKFVSMAAACKERTLLVQSMSKNFAMTGFRVGFLCANETILSRAKSLQSHFYTSTSTLSQVCALEALRNTQQIISGNRRHMHARRDLLVEGLKSVGLTDFVVPASALYLLLHIGKLTKFGNSDIEICKRVLKDFQIAMVPGSGFHAESYVRVSFGSQTEAIEMAIQRLQEAL